MAIRGRSILTIRLSTRQKDIPMLAQRVRSMQTLTFRGMLLFS